METSRSAHHSIAGYAYQFDKSLIEILGAAEGVTVTLEGIEDIDVGEESIQCKYYSSQTYAPSRIRSALFQFLAHYAGSSSRNFVYTLYAHFNQGVMPAAFSLSEFRLHFGDYHRGLSLTDDDLSKFLADHLRCIAARAFDEQRVDALNALRGFFSCTRHEAEDYFYANGLHEIIRLSRQPSVEARSITRAQFGAAINKKCRLFSLWLFQLKGERDYLKHVRKGLNSMNALSPSKDKHFLLTQAFAERSGIDGMSDLCSFLVDRFYQLQRALRDAVPPTVIVEGRDDHIIKLKRAVLANKVPINDGFEHIAFQPDFFDASPVINTRTTRNGRATDTIAIASYVIRIVAATTYKNARSSLRRPHVLFATGPDLDPADCHAAETIHLHSVNSHDQLISILQ